MAEANRKEEVNAGIAAVWDLITSLENYSWRSDLDRIEILEPGKTFREYTRDGFATTFTITVCKPMNRYEFDMENENIQGHWIGILEQTQRGTMLDFTEKVTAKKGVDEALCGNVSCQTAESIYGGFEESTEYGRCPGRLIKYPQKNVVFLYRSECSGNC